MNVKELPDGKVLVICRAGCTNAEIIAAAGLHWTALFPESDQGRATYADYRKEAKRFPAADVLEAVSGEALLAAVAASNIANGVELTEADRRRLLIAANRIAKARDMANG
jgi:predicted nicotinamide N-methyase